jgi:hypothetical protein
MPENPEARKRVTRTALLDLEDMAQFLAPDSALALRELVKFYERRSPDDASYIEGGIALDSRIVSAGFSTSRPPRTVEVYADHPEVGKVKVRITAMPKGGHFIINVNNRAATFKVDPLGPRDA